MSNARILFVDDDEHILKGIKRQQGADFDITTAIGPMEALEILESEEFAVIVSDMRMPEMNGVQLLKRVREIHPDSVRMILTGFAELNTAIEAVNEGHIFRFLAKPCDEDLMADSLQAGLRQFALIEAERELVEGTLHGCVKVLADVLSLVNPLAFGQSTRVRTNVDGILKRLDIPDQWQLEIAAMLSSLGCVTLPTDLLKKKLNGMALSPEERTQYDNHPELASELLQSIPRLQEVSAIISGLSDASFVGLTEDDRKKSSVLRLAQDFDFYELNSESSLHALDKLKSVASDRYDSELFDALTEFVKQDKNIKILEVDIDDVQEGMVLADDIRNEGGTLLMSKGQKITASALRMLENISANQDVGDKVKVVGEPALCESA